MNLEINDILIRLGEKQLSNLFVSDSAFDILKALDSKLIYPKNIREMILKYISKETMLRERHMRNTLFEALKLNEAKKLAEVLNISYSDNVYNTISNVRIIKNSNREIALFDFFNVKIPPLENFIRNPNRKIVIPKRGLFAHQYDALLKIKKHLKDHKHRTMLHMPTGAGKTRTAIRTVISQLLENQNDLIIWLAYSEELCVQAVDEFAKTWEYVGDREIKIIHFYGNITSKPIQETKNHQGCFMVAGLKKIYEAAKRDNIFLSTLADRASLIIMDEAHQAMAPTYQFILKQLVEKHEKTKLLGLSATPGHTWNDPDRDKHLADFFNRNKVTLDTPGSPVNFLIKNGYIARPKSEKLELPQESKLTIAERQRISNALDIPDDILKKLSQDKLLNLKIISKVEELINIGHKRIILFASNINHVKDISIVLSIRGNHSHYITSNTPHHIRRDILEDYLNEDNKHKIVCNYGVLTMGFDAPKTSAIVIARPTKSLVLYSQMVGRGIRGPKAGGNKDCTIVTVADTSRYGFDSITDAFSNWDDVWK